MEKRINKKIHQFFLDFKQDIKNEFDKYPDMDREHYSSILQFVYDYPNVEIDKTDLTKRKRVKIVRSILFGIRTIVYVCRPMKSSSFEASRNLSSK